MFDDVYDNGYMLLGKVKNVKEYIIKNSEGIEDTDVEGILEELKDLYTNDIVAINYGHPMGYTIDYWTYNDIVNKP